MIPILYPADQPSAINTLGIGLLADAISCTVTEEINGIFELEMTYPVTGVLYDELQVGMVIGAVSCVKGSVQLFDIYEITKPITGIATIRACHVSYRLRHIPLSPFSAQGIQEVFGENGALRTHNMVSWTEQTPFTFWTDLTGTDAYNLRYPANIRGKLQGDQWSILQEYGGEYEWDNFNVKLWESRGSDKGVEIRYGVNMINMNKDESILNTVVGIVPFWYGIVGEEEELVWLPERILWSSHVSEFPRQTVLCVDMTDQFDEKPTEQRLRTRGNYYIRKNKVGVPKVNIDVSFVDLSQVPEYANIPFETIKLCDTVTVIFPELGVKTKEKVARTIYNVLLDRYDQISIGDIQTSTLSGTITTQDMSISEVTQAAKQQITNLLVGTIESYSSDKLKYTKIVAGEFSNNYDVMSGASPNPAYAPTVKIETDVGSNEVNGAVRVLNYTLGGMTAGDETTVSTDELLVGMSSALLPDNYARARGNIVGGKGRFNNTLRLSNYWNTGGVALQFDEDPVKVQVGNVIKSISFKPAAASFTAGTNVTINRANVKNLNGTVIAHGAITTSAQISANGVIAAGLPMPPGQVDLGLIGQGAAYRCFVNTNGRLVAGMTIPAGVYYFNFSYFN